MMKNIYTVVLLCGIFCVCDVNTSSSTETTETPYKAAETPTSPSGLLGLLEQIFLFPLTFLQVEPESSTGNDVISADNRLQFCDRETIFDVFIDAVTALVSRIWGLIEENYDALGIWDFHLNRADGDSAENGLGIISEAFGQISRLLPLVNVVHNVAKSSLNTAIEIVDFANTRMRAFDVLTKISNITSQLLAIMTMTWMTMLRCLVAGILAVSCFQYILPKESYNGKTKRRNPMASLVAKFKRNKQPISPLSSPRAQGHFPMCEVYDTLPCNCGGRRTSPSLKKKHYLMCEIFDQQLCNCGGRRKGLSQLEKHYAMCEVFDGECCNCGGIVAEKGTPIDAIVLDNPEAFINCKRTKSEGLNELSKSFQESQSDMSEIKDDSKINTSITRTVASNDDAEEMDKPDAIYCGGGELLELDSSLSSDIGHPCCNSSFKEESPLQDDTNSHFSDFFSPASGDGVGMKLSPRRSPQKRRGQDESSWADESGSYWSFYDAESFLENSDLNNSISFQRGDGIVEIAMVLLVKGAIKITAWFLQKQGIIKAADCEKSYTENANANSELQRRRPRSRIRYNRTFSRSRNNSAVELDDDTLKPDSMHSVLEDFAIATEKEYDMPKSFFDDSVEKRRFLSSYDINNTKHDGVITNTDTDNDFNEVEEANCNQEPVRVVNSEDDKKSWKKIDGNVQGIHNIFTPYNFITNNNNQNIIDDRIDLHLGADNGSITSIEETGTSSDKLSNPQNLCIVSMNGSGKDPVTELLLELGPNTLENDSSFLTDELDANRIEKTHLGSLNKCTVTDTIKQHELIDEYSSSLGLDDNEKLNLRTSTACVPVFQHFQPQESIYHTSTMGGVNGETDKLKICTNSTSIPASEVVAAEDGGVLLSMGTLKEAKDDPGYAEDNKTPELSASDGYLTDSSG